MDSPKRVLIVEPDRDFGLTLASLFHEDGLATRTAGSAAEAELEIAGRRPGLCVVRAELPDLSGFSLCAQLRHDPATARLPVILYSSDTPPASLAEHARTPWAANGYLAMPLDTAALRKLAFRILSTAEPVESADDAVMVEEEEERRGAAEIALVADAGLAGAGEGTRAASPPAEVAAKAPPPVPRRPERSTVTDEDRLYVDRVFQSVAEHREALLSEVRRRRPPPRRERYQTPEGRAEGLREDLRWREAQIARLAEVWEVRERELSAFDERMHEKDVELAGHKAQIEDLLQRLASARELFVEKEREYGASVDGLLLEKFSQEKELIEVVAASERRIHELERELRGREDELAQRKIALDRAQEEIARQDRQVQKLTAAAAAREEELSADLSRLAEHLAASEALGNEARRAAAEAAAQAASRLAAEEEARRRAEEEGARARSEGEELRRQMEAQRIEAEGRAAARAAEHKEERAEAERVRALLEASAEEVRAALREAEDERERAQEGGRQAAALLQQRIEEREATIREREAHGRRLEEEHRRFRDAARAREGDQDRELDDHLRRIAGLEAEAQRLTRELTEAEVVAAADLTRLKNEHQADRAAGERRREEEVAAAGARAAEAERRLAEAEETIEQLRTELSRGERAAATAQEVADGAREEERTRAQARLQAVAAERDAALADAERGRARAEEAEGEAQWLRAAFDEQAARVAEAEAGRDAALAEAGAHAEARNQAEVRLAARASESEISALALEEAREEGDARVADVLAALAAARAEAEALRRDLSGAREALAAREAELRLESAARADGEEATRRALEGAQAERARREGELSAALDKAGREAGRAAVAGRKVAELEALVAGGAESRARLEQQLSARIAAAEVRAAEAARRLDQLASERAEAEARAARAVRAAEDAQDLLRDDLARRDALRAQEVQRLQAALSELARREKALQQELARARAPAGGTGAA